MVSHGWLLAAVQGLLEVMRNGRGLPKSEISNWLWLTLNTSAFAGLAGAVSAAEAYVETLAAGAMAQKSASAACLAE